MIHYRPSVPPSVLQLIGMLPLFPAFAYYCIIASISLNPYQVVEPWQATLELAALLIGLVFFLLGYRFSNKPHLTLLHWLGFGGLLALLGFGAMLVAPGSKDGWAPILTGVLFSILILGSIHLRKQPQR